MSKAFNNKGDKKSGGSKEFKGKSSYDGGSKQYGAKSQSGGFAKKSFGRSDGGKFGGKPSRGGKFGAGNHRPGIDGIRVVKSEGKKEVDQDTLTLRRLYNKLMLKKESNKADLINKIFALVKGNFSAYAFKHDGCRVLQGCIKYGNKSQRKEVISHLKEIIYDLAIKKYSIYLAIKMWKYSEKEQQESLLPHIFPKLSHLLKCASGQTLINFIIANSTSKVQNLMLKEYCHRILKFNLDDLSEFKTMDVDEEVKESDNVLVTRGESYFSEKFKEEMKKKMELILEKKSHTNSLFHLALSTLFDMLSSDVKSYFSELFDDDYEVFLNTKQGVELGIKLYVVASAKTRKKIIKKVFKDEWTDSLLANENNINLVTKLLMCTDDTKLSAKYLFKPLIIYAEKTDFRILIKVVHGIVNPHKVSSVLEYSADASTKKDSIKIQTELLSACSEELKNAINVNAEKFFVENEMSSALLDLLELSVANCENKEIGSNQALLEIIISSILESIYSYVEFDILNNEEKITFTKPGQLFVVGVIKRTLIEKATNNEVINKFAIKLSNLISSNFELFIKTKGAFIILNLYENQHFGKSIVQLVKNNKSVLTQILKDDPKSKVIEILLKKLSEIKA